MWVLPWAKSPRSVTVTSRLQYLAVNSYFYAGLPAPATLRWRTAASQHVTCLSVGIEAAKVPEYPVCILPGGNMYTEEVISSG